MTFLMFQSLYMQVLEAHQRGEFQDKPVIIVMEDLNKEQHSKSYNRVVTLIWHKTVNVTITIIGDNIYCNVM